MNSAKGFAVADPAVEVVEKSDEPVLYGEERAIWYVLVEGIGTSTKKALWRRGKRLCSFL